MKALFLGLMLCAMATGCVSKSGARREAQRAVFEEQQRSFAEQTQQQPAVWFRGDVRNQRVPWTDELTLAQALMAAQYTGNWDPRIITVTRAGEVHSVNTRRLLRGQDNPVLEPNDIVEVRR